MDESSLWWGLVFGSIGLGYFIYGTRQKAPIPLVSGIGLMVFPYVVSNPWLMGLLGLALMALPYFVRL